MANEFSILGGTVTGSEITSALGGAVAGAAVGAGTTYLIMRKSSKKHKKFKNKNSRKRISRSRRRKRGRRTPHTAGKRKDRSMRRIRYTSTGQPYILLRNGKARFIKRSSAKRSHRQKGGRY